MFHFLCVRFSGQGIVFTVDEITGALLVSHRLSLSSCDFPGKQASHYTGAWVMKRLWVSGKQINFV